MQKYIITIYILGYNNPLIDILFQKWKKEYNKGMYDKEVLV